MKRNKRFLLLRIVIIMGGFNYFSKDFNVRGRVEVRMFSSEVLENFKFVILVFSRFFKFLNIGRRRKRV